MDKRQGKQTMKMEEAPETYEERKLKLQRHLIKLYQTYHSFITVYPLRPSLTEELDTMFVRQEMIENDPRGSKQPFPDILEGDKLEYIRGHEVIKIQTLKEVFFKDGTLCKDIYVTGEAGVGKSTFCKYIVNMWVKAHTGKNVKSSRDIKTSDIETMKKFPLLFYVQLRGVMLGTETDTFASLIKTQLNLDNELKDFLKEENCLVICDSLDETASGLPSRDVLNKSTRLITSRPWKLETLREKIEGKAIDRQIEIVCIDEKSSETLVKNLLSVLAQESVSNSDKNYHSFLNKMKGTGLVSFLRIPVLLVQIICLWYEDNLEVEESQSSIYKKLLHYQIMVYFKKSKTIDQLYYGKYNPLRCRLVKCPCSAFSDIMINIGKLALHAVVTDNRENELCFDHNSTEMFGLCEKDVETCLKIGILSQHKLFGKITEEPKKFLSFVHKSNREFIASLYLSYKVPISDIKSELNTAIGTLDRMLELKNVLVFVSGLNLEMGRDMAYLLLKTADQDPRIKEYRQTLYGHDELVSNIQTAILDANAECEIHQNQQLFRLDDVRVNKDNISCVLSCITAGSLVTSICMQGAYNTFLPAYNVMSRIDTSRLQKVDLFDCTISGDSLSQVVSRSLSALSLSYVTMSHTALESLDWWLSAASNLRWVRLEWLQCETHGRLYEERCAPLSLDFGSNVVLKNLDIYGCVMASCMMSPGLVKLEEVTLGVVTAKAAILKQLVDSFPGNNVKVTLDGVMIRNEAGEASPWDIFHEIRQSCTVVEDRVERRENGDLFVMYNPVLSNSG